VVVRNDWEGEAAVQLESLAGDWDGPTSGWNLEISTGSGRPALPSVALLTTAADRLLAGDSPQRVAAEFHATFCKLAVDLTTAASARAGGVVALGGGCLVNRILRQTLHDALTDAGFSPRLATDVPPGDGGLAYGQAVLAAVGAARDVKLRTP
jgi:hydrogenase maturation protein HypF